MLPIVTSETSISPGVLSSTVTTQVAVLLLDVFAVMVVSPSALAVTFPEVLTVAIEVSLDVQVSVPISAQVGLIELELTLSVSVSPTSKVVSDLFKLKLDIAGLSTVKVNESGILSAVAVIVVVPTPLIVSFPVEASIVATLVLEELQLTVGYVALFGETVASKSL